MQLSKKKKKTKVFAVKQECPASVDSLVNAIKCPDKVNPFITLYWELRVSKYSAEFNTSFSFASVNSTWRQEHPLWYVALYFSSSKWKKRDISTALFPWCSPPPTTDTQFDCKQNSWCDSNNNLNNIKPFLENVTMNYQM